MNPPPPPVVEANTTLPTPTPVIPDLPKENLIHRLHLDHYFEVFSFGDASQRASILQHFSENQEHIRFDLVAENSKQAVASLANLGPS